MEVRQETDYVRHHVQKVIAYLSAMREFARYLRSRGHRVVYIPLDDPGNQQSIKGNILRLVRKSRFARFEYLLPDEYRLDADLHDLAAGLSVETGSYDTEHFLTTRYELRDLFGEKHYLMETFYRHMRRKLGILMHGDGPEGGRWNFDVENRESLDAGVEVPEPLEFSRDVVHLYELIGKCGVKTMGRVDPARFKWPVSRRESLRLLRFFLENCLQHFGTYEDAMSSDHYSLFHSRLSFSMNTKLLGPGEVVDRALRHWRLKKRTVTLSQIEGFVRQIIGWREFMRGVYWANMPAYGRLNFFNHRGGLPAYYWNGETRMRCMKLVLGQSLDEAYAHHIQRLMVAGNFALLAGVSPDEVDEWYLGVYIDAIEWVEITNTRGMSQFADGGMVATKPYIASSNYIHRMSDYCEGCHYDRSKRHGDRACPFNSLYWEFLHRHRARLAPNPRLGVMYRTLDRMDRKEREATLKQARSYRRRLGSL